MISKTFLKRRVTNFTFFFCFLTNTVYLNKKQTWLKHTLMSRTVIVLRELESKSFWLLKFFSKADSFWIIFWQIATLNRVINCGFYVEIELIGLGFRIKKILTSIYRFFWGVANFIYLFVPNGILVEYLADERTMFFFGFNASLVNNISTYLMLLKKLSVYRIYGFIKPGKIVRLNSGKQR